MPESGKRLRVFGSFFYSTCCDDRAVDTDDVTTDVTCLWRHCVELPGYYFIACTTSTFVGYFVV